MSVRLVLLGLLRDHPMHGYEIKQTIEDRMGDWTSIAFGSIYHALAKLTGEGLIEKAAVEQEGSRPSRTIYQITDSGRAEFMRLLRELWQDVEQNYYAIDIGLYFMHALPPNEVIAYLIDRLAQLEEIIQYLDAHRIEQTEMIKQQLLSNPQITEAISDHVMLRVDAIFEHSKRHYQTELEWTRDLLARLNQGEGS
jgi:DNA-binding PadR family transcriptional regulator